MDKCCDICFNSIPMCTGDMKCGCKESPRYLRIVSSNYCCDHFYTLINYDKLSKYFEKMHSDLKDKFDKMMCEV